MPIMISSRTNRQRGLSLVELMVSITLGLLILAGVTTIFTNTSRTRTEIEKTSRQIENGRYAMQVLADDLQTAGFFAEFDPSVLVTTTLTALPDPCSTDLAAIKTNGVIALHVQGYDNAATVPSCLSDVKTGTDILVIRRASTCIAGAAGCDAFAGGVPHFQASLCTPATGGTELASADASNAGYAAGYYALDTAAANLTRHKIDCTTVAVTRRYRTHIYFIANNNVGSDGVPTLKRAELGAAFTIVPLVEGIENLQFEYGIDTDATPDGVPNVYNADPTSYGGCAGTACVSNWRNVMAVKINLLARNTEKSGGYADSKTYVLGLDKDGNSNTVGPFGDQYKRHAYTGTVRLANPAGRKE